MCVYAVAGYERFLVKLYRVGCFLCCLERKLLCHSTWVLIIGVLTIPRISAARKNSHLSAALKMPFSAVDVLVNQTERVRRAVLPYAMVKGIQCHFSFSSPSGRGDFYKSFICSHQNYQVPAAPAAARTGRRAISTNLIRGQVEQEGGQSEVCDCGPGKRRGLNRYLGRQMQMLKMLLQGLLHYLRFVRNELALLLML